MVRSVSLRSESAEPSDAALLERLRDGDDHAFTMIYRRHSRVVAGRIYRLLGDDEALDDLVQETFIHGLAGLDGLKEANALRGWLLTIAVRRVQRHLGRRYRQRTIAEAVRSSAPRVGDARRQDEVHGLYRSLAKLPAKLRLPWLLHRVEGETLPAVAEACSCSLTSSKRYIAEADRRLRRMGHET
ncbi:MAG: sigma-70 family RNA polymerase sigma factor [Myxococcota bacterium]